MPVVLDNDHHNHAATAFFFGKKAPIQKQSACVKKISLKNISDNCIKDLSIANAGLTEDGVMAFLAAKTHKPKIGGFL